MSIALVESLKVLAENDMNTPSLYDERKNIDTTTSAHHILQMFKMYCLSLTKYSRIAEPFDIKKTVNMLK